MLKKSNKSTKPPSRLTESKIQASIIDKLKIHGWEVFKIIQSNRNGIPDLMCLRRGRCVFVEVKARGKTSTPLQVYVQNRIRAAGVDVYEANDPGFLI